MENDENNNDNSIASEIDPHQKILEIEVVDRMGNETEEREI